MSTQKPIISPSEAATVLKAADALKQDPVTDAIRQVAAKQAISGPQRETLESLVASGTAEQTKTALVKAAGRAGNPEAKLGRGGRRAERDLAVQARRQMIISLRFRWPPTPVREIARQLGISPCTVIADMNAIRRERAEMFTGTRGQEMVAESIAQLEIIAIQSLGTASEHKSPATKARQRRVAISAIEAKVRMMQDSGMAPRPPSKSELSGPNGGPIAIQTDEAKTLTKAQKIAAMAAAREAKAK
jgi:hypothetical protein